MRLRFFPLVAFMAAPLHAQPVGYDVTRIWTECVAQTGSCATLLLRTYGNAGGGSHVTIGLASLAGDVQSVAVAAPSLLTGATFKFTDGPGGFSNDILSGTASGGASGSSTMHFVESGNSLNLRSVLQSQTTPGSVHLDNTYYSCDVPDDCQQITLQHYTSTVATSNTQESVQGLSSQGYLAGDEQPSNPYFSYYAGANSSLHCTTFTCWTVYHPYEVPQFAGYANDYTYMASTAGWTPAGSMFLYDFDSDGEYDARNVSSAFYTAVSDAAFFAHTPLTPCENFECTVLSDETFENPLESPAPEPAAIIYITTGLALFGVARRTRARTPAASRPVPISRIAEGSGAVSTSDTAYITVPEPISA